MSGLRAPVTLLCAALLAGACAGTSVGTPTPPPTGTPTLEPTASAPATDSPTASPSAPPITLPPVSPSSSAQVGLPSTGCVSGWQAVTAESAVGAEGLALLAGSMGLDAPLIVADMRYFTGPDVPWIIEPHYEVVARWYIKATLSSDPAFRGRWLIEQRSDTVKGVSAVAPFDTVGYESPDWVGFVGEGPPTTYPGLPGAWSGIAFDFVTGEGDSDQPGLPDEVADCLAGT